MVRERETGQALTHVWEGLVVAVLHQELLVLLHLGPALLAPPAVRQDLFPAVLVGRESRDLLLQLGRMARLNLVGCWEGEGGRRSASASGPLGRHAGEGAGD